MQTLKVELAIAGVAMFALGAFVATRPTDAEAASAEPPAVRAFSERDFAVFDRGFLLDDTLCAVGFERHMICFAPSPLEAEMRPGMTVAPDVPLVAAEFRVIVETDLKDQSLRTVRFGQSLALVDPETREIVDLIRLSATDYASARPDGLTKS
jgi:hypothetical protein